MARDARASHHPGAVLAGRVPPAGTFLLLYLWPFIEQKLTGDRAGHELLDRPRNRPVRTAVGTGVLSFCLVLFGAGSQDVIAQHLGVSVFQVKHTFQALTIVVPAVVALVAWKWCSDLAAADRHAATGPSLWPPAPGAAPPVPPAPRRGLRERLERVATVASIIGGVAVAVRGRRAR